MPKRASLANMGDHGRMTRLALSFIVSVVVLSGCALFRNIGESGAQSTDRASPPIDPAASASPGTSSERTYGPDLPAASAAASAARSAVPARPTTTADRSHPMETGVLTGSLGFDSAEAGCPYLETADGTRFQVVYPAGWQIDRATGQLVGPDGTRSQLGTTVSIRGSVRTDMASICQVGPIFLASEVISAGG
jgi:hypothetical protein